MGEEKEEEEEVGKKKLMEVEDMVCRILSKLPVKSLLICKSVCKDWRRLISSPYLVGLQLNKSKENPTYIVLVKTWFPDNQLVKFDEDIFEDIPLPGVERNHHRHNGRIICSFNGLIFWGRFSRSYPKFATKIYVYNPATRRDVLLPEAPHHKHHDRFGVAFGPHRDQMMINHEYYFKVYGFFPKSGDESITECEVYSSITKSWKGLGRPVPLQPLDSRHICINGILYWFMNSRDSILALDREENFVRISLPRQILSDKKQGTLFLVDFEGCLSLIHAYRMWFSLWVLKEEMNESSWVERCSSGVPNIEGRRILHGRVVSATVRRNEILIIVMDREGMQQCLIYDVDKETIKEATRLINAINTRDHLTLFAFAYTFTFTESLLPPM